LSVELSVVALVILGRLLRPEKLRFSCQLSRRSCSGAFMLTLARIN
jgi:hypothetical protein